MTKNDWVGLSVSIGVHLCLLLFFAVITAARPAAQLGFMEVEVGPFMMGRPVQQALEQRPDDMPVTRETRPRPEPQREAATQPEEAKPVQLPTQTDTRPSEDVVHTPDTDVISPTTRDSRVEERAQPRPEPEPVRPLGSGSTRGTTGAADGEAGSGADESRRAPYSIEGIDRTPLRAPLPTYAEKVNADIQVRITVDPTGRIVRSIPLRKANAALEQAIMEALRNWQFNALARNVPQENQEGVVTFRFRLQ